MQNVYYSKSTLLDKLISYIVSYNKICIACFAGNIATPFFGLFLASDIRFAAENTSFSLSHHEYGLHPSGALPFFLIQEIGYSKAIEIMLSVQFSVSEAHNLHMVNKVFRVNDYLMNCLEHVHNKYSQINYSTVINTKRLAAYAREEIEDYIQYEKTLLNLFKYR